MRAGLLSDPRVVVALRTLFVPVHMSALNTPHCMRDPRDVELLAKYAGDATDRFQGGEREAFVLPDGRMQRVFLSLNCHDVGAAPEGRAQYTAADRRSDDALRMFRRHGANALCEVHGEQPPAWRELWDGETPAVRALLEERPRWPQPAAGQQGFRVFVRNSYHMYDDLHGQQNAVLPDEVVAAWIAPLTEPARRAVLPAEHFLALARAIVPRGQVDTELAASSIDGEFALVAESVDAQRVVGRVEGRFALTPKDKSEVGKRGPAASLFRSAGTFAGRFVLDAQQRTFVELRAVATDVELVWLSSWAGNPRDGEGERANHRIAIEWVRTPRDAAR